MSKLDAIREVFGIPDVFTVCPRTYGEFNPAGMEMQDSDESWMESAYALLDGGSVK